MSVSDIKDAWRLEGRIAFVTGAGGAIGRSVCLTLAEAGARVVCADRNAEAAEATASLVQGDVAAFDVSDAEAFDKAVRGAAARLGGLDVMCNLAGVSGRSQRIVDLEEAAFDDIFSAHFKGVLFGCQAALRVMLPACKGAIINMSSEAIDLAPATITGYSSAKAAISMMTRVLAAEVAPQGVRANAVAPSFIPSDLSLVRFKDDTEGRERYLDWWKAKSPLGALCSVEDVARQVLYLASDASGFVTGQTLRTNGGISMPW